jgi:hypothetical protein
MIEVRVDDLAFYQGEAIVRPVTAELGATTPLLRRLEAAAGGGLQEQLRKQDALPVGSAVVSAAGALGVELMVRSAPFSALSIGRSGRWRSRPSGWGRAIWRSKTALPFSPKSWPSTSAAARAFRRR